MRILIFLFLGTLCFEARSQQAITTYILLRHAEKGDDGTKDPDLSDAGKRRAEGLVKLLAQQKIDAIYSTPFKRTRNTVAPLALAKGLTVVDYDATHLQDVITASLKFKGGTIVICGHSNTTPALLNLIMGSKDEFKTFDDTDYSNLVIVNVPFSGKGKITWLTY